MSDLNASLAECNTKMNKAIDVAKEDFATIRTGRAHPAMFAKLMRELFVDDGVVLDLWLGSGTTLIAAEQLGRKCYGMEISPQYCDVIVKRWETLTGRVATRA